MNVSEYNISIAICERLPRLCAIFLQMSSGAVLLRASSRTVLVHFRCPVLVLAVVMAP